MLRRWNLYQLYRSFRIYELCAYFLDRAAHGWQESRFYIVEERKQISEYHGQAIEDGKKVPEI